MWVSYCLNDCFLTQNVIEHTFQKFGRTTNTLDLILTETSNRIYMLQHLPPLKTGPQDCGHLVLDFRYSLATDTTTRHSDYKCKHAYNKGKYEELEKYFNSFDWENVFQNLTVNECYTKWLEIYETGCKTYIPMSNADSRKRNTPWFNSEIKKKEMVV
jgi:hypothetical protein